MGLVDYYSNQLDKENSAEEVSLCVILISYGSVFAKPSYRMCFVSLNVSDNVTSEAAAACGFDTDDKNWHISVSKSPGHGQCAQTSGSYFLQFKVKWVGNKIKYVMYGTSIVFFLAALSFRRYLGGQNSKFKLIFVLCNVVWVMWGLQETLQQETMFRDRLPYSCIAMYYIQYLSQTTSLYLFTCLSVVRLYSVVSPLQHRCGSSSLGKLKCLVVVLAVTVGSACATLNLASILTLQDIAAKKTCRLSVSDSVDEYLGFALIVKVLTLILVFLLPCIILVCSNVATIVHLKKSPKVPIRRSRKNVRNLNMNLFIILFSSIFVLCCLPKPVLDVHMVSKVYITGADADTKLAEVISEVVFANLGILAFVISTVVGIRYST